MRLRPTQDKVWQLRDALREKLRPERFDGIISMHLIETDAALSGPTAEIPSVPNPGANDWLVLIDGTQVSAISAVIAERFTGPAASPFSNPVSVGTYSLMWDLANSDIARA